MEHDDEEIILTLVNQLEGSEYYKDKYEALKKLEIISRNNAFLVGVHALDIIIHSMLTMDNFDLQQNILERVFRSREKNAFVEIFFKNDSNVEIIFDRYETTYNICKVLAHENGVHIYNILKNQNSLGEMIENIEKSISFIHYLIIPGNKEFFIFQGLFEKVLSIINNKNYTDCLKTIEALLIDSDSAQEYFCELNWITTLNKYNIAGICTILLNIRSVRLRKVQDIMNNNNILFLEDKDFISKFIHRNPNNLIEIEKAGFDIYKTLNELNYDNKNNYSILVLLSEILSFKSIDIVKIDNQQFYFSILSVIVVHDKEIVLPSNVIDECLYSISSYADSEKSSFHDNILLLIFVSDYYKIDLSFFNMINEICNNKSINIALKSLVILLIISVTDNYIYFSLTPDIILYYLQYLRNNISHLNYLLTDYMLHILHRIINKNINRFIVDENYRNEYEELCVKSKESENIIIDDISESVTDEQILKNNNTLFKNTLRTGKERFKSLMERKKQENNDKDDIFDL